MHQLRRNAGQVASRYKVKAPYKSSKRSPPIAFPKSFFIDTSSLFLTKHYRKEMSKRPEMKRDGTTFVPRVRGSSESISRVGGAAGILQKRPK
jgi:hypothetical protein